MLNILKKLFVILLTIAFSAGAEANSTIDDHFFITKVSSKNFGTKNPKTKSLTLSDCRAKISQAICLVDPVIGEPLPQTRKCLPGGKSYAHYFEELFDNYPTNLKKVFCSIEYLFIEKQFNGTAYAGILKDENGQTHGAQLGIRKSVLDEQIDLKSWASWKEQLSFGGIVTSYTLSDDLPLIETKSKIKTNDFLYFVIAHEFGHIIDFTNDLNKTKNCDITHENEECEMDENGWGGISWETDRRAKLENEFTHRTFLCFYNCNNQPIEYRDITRVYADMLGTDFISLYATTQPWDDFADSLAYFIMHKELDTSYQINTRQGNVIDVMDKIRSEKWKKKYDYLKDLLMRSDLKYP